MSSSVGVRAAGCREYKKAPPTNATLAKTQAVGTIVNDDADTIPPTITARTPAPLAIGVAVNTVVTATFSESMNADLAYNLVRTILEHRSEIAEAHKEAATISLENQTNDRSPIPFHPGAIKYFAEKGVKVK